MGPSREMAAIVKEWGCGVVSQDFSSSFADTLGEARRGHRQPHKATQIVLPLCSTRNATMVRAGLVREAIESSMR
jgi:hypothetical protein